MQYISTRAHAPSLAFEDVLLTGLARDGGLYVPDAWPQISSDVVRCLDTMRYEEAAFKIMRLYVDGEIPDEDLFQMVEKSYSAFRHRDIVPLTALDDSLYVMELFHGPTLAFKDVALQFLGQAFDYVLSRRGTRCVIIGATSGDTGSAAIEAVRGKENIRIFMMHPKGRVSDVQRRQMTTVADDNVHNIAVEGTFDDCQALVKAMFNHQEFRARHHLAAVNSINWVRIMAQIVYYIIAAAKMDRTGGACAFAVPTGNFGNVFAGYAAKNMGINITQLLVASNQNDILTRFFDSGTMRMRQTHATISPSMDIQVSSNFERLLFDLYARDGDALSTCMQTFAKTGCFSVTEAMHAEARTLFDAVRFDDRQTMAAMRAFYDKTGTLIDPHSAVAYAAALEGRRDKNIPMAILATAHPAKFPDAVQQATGMVPQLPAHMADLHDRAERYHTLANDLDVVEAHIEATLRD